MEEMIGYEDEFPGLPYRDFFSPEEWDAIVSGDWSKVPPDDFSPRKSSLSEDDAYRIARSLEDYGGVTVTDLGGSNEHSYWADVRNELTDTTHEINSWQDYWDFLVTFLSGKQQLRSNAHVLSSGVTELGLGGAAADDAPEEIHSTSVGPSAATSVDNRNVKNDSKISAAGPRPLRRQPGDPSSTRGFREPGFGRAPFFVGVGRSSYLGCDLRRAEGAGRLSLTKTNLADRKGPHTHSSSI